MSIRALLFAFLPLAAAAQDLPMTGLGGVGLMTADLEKARQFYSGMLGCSEAFTLKNEAGRVVSSFFKVNDDQFIQLVAGPYADIRMAYIAVLTPDAQGMRKALLKRGVIPGLPAQQPDGALAFSLKDPDGAPIEFVERTPDSLEAKLRGKLLSPRRISAHMAHVGVLSADADRSIAFYGGKLGFTEIWRGGAEGAQTRWINMKLPGNSTDYFELMLYSGQLSHDQYGALQHICLEVGDLKVAIDKLRRNGYGGPRLESRVGQNGRRQLNLYDADGTRVELMEPRPAK